MEVRDNQGRKIGTVGYADSSWVTCLTVIVVIVAIIGGGLYGISMLANQIKGHNVHTHDSLRNIQIPNGYAGISDSDGLHITDGSYTASSDNTYGDVDVSVTAKLVSYAHPDNPYA